MRSKLRIAFSAMLSTTLRAYELCTPPPSTRSIESSTSENPLGSTSPFAPLMTPSTYSETSCFFASLPRFLYPARTARCSAR